MKYAAAHVTILHNKLPHIRNRHNSQNFRGLNSIGGNMAAAHLLICHFPKRQCHTGPHSASHITSRGVVLVTDHSGRRVQTSDYAAGSSNNSPCGSAVGIKGTGTHVAVYIPRFCSIEPRAVGPLHCGLRETSAQFFRVRLGSRRFRSGRPFCTHFSTSQRKDLTTFSFSASMA